MFMQQFQSADAQTDFETWWLSCGKVKLRPSSSFSYRYSFELIFSLDFNIIFIFPFILYSSRA